MTFTLFQGAAGTNLCPGGVLVSLRSGHTRRIPLVLLRRHADGLRYTPGERINGNIFCLPGPVTTLWEHNASMVPENRENH